MTIEPSDIPWPSLLDSKADFPKVRFQGKEYIFVDGAITTKEAYLNFDESYAHLYEDGAIRRYGQQIGTKEDLEFLK
jgi:hypothetical protein